MLIVMARYSITPNERDNFISAVNRLNFLEECRQEKGNISYDYYFPIDSENDVLAVELWEAREFWDVHKTTPHVAQFQDIKKTYVTGMQPASYEIKG